MLTCTKCKTDKPASAEYFPLHNKKINGLDSWCRECRAGYRSGINRGMFRDVISDEALKELKASVTQCVICGSQEKLVVDHDHKTGRVRSLLCMQCNAGLGNFRENINILENSIIYF